MNLHKKIIAVIFIFVLTLNSASIFSYAAETETHEHKFVNHICSECDKIEDYTGVVYFKNKWIYVENGVADTTFTGLAQNENGIWYLKDGNVQFDCTVLIYITGKSWCYIKSGKYIEDYEGLATNKNGTWYLKNGKVQFDCTELVYINGKSWCCIIKGKYYPNYTGFSENANGKWYIKNGKVQFDASGLINVSGYGWWYIENGKVDFSYTGLAKNQNGTWYIESGELNWNYTGLYEDKDVTWYIEKGKLNQNYTGLIHGKVGWWYVENGKINLNYNGMAHNQNGWWYIENGTVNFNYTGLASNEHGVWCFKNGQLDWSKAGTEKIAKGEVRYSNGQAIYARLNVSAVSQLPDYPTGCEAASATTVMKFYGINISLKEMVDAIPRQNLYKKNGKTYGPSIYEKFVGDPRGTYTSGTPGYGAFSPVITKSMNKVFAQKNSSLKAKNVTGATVNELCSYVAQGKLVIVWATYKMVQPTQENKWIIETPNGDVPFSYPRKTHVMVLVGYDASNVYIADPYDTSSILTFKKSLFTARYNLLGNQAIIVE